MRIKILKDYNHGRAKFRVANTDEVIVTAELGAFLISIGVARDISSTFPTSVEFDKKLKAQAPPTPRDGLKKFLNRKNKTNAPKASKKRKLAEGGLASGPSFPHNSPEGTEVVVPFSKLKELISPE